MAQIRPFRGLRYSLRFAPDLARVLAPPYDIISPKGQEELHARTPYNIVRLEHGESRPGDNPQDNRYTRAAALLQEWLERGVLIAEGPAFYLHHHTFFYGGKRLT